MTEEQLISALLARTQPAPADDDAPKWSPIDMDRVKAMLEDRWLAEASE